MCCKQLGFKDLVEKYRIPFKCAECGDLKLDLAPRGDLTFLWQDPPKEKTGCGLIIPEIARMLLGSATVLAIGKGYFKKSDGSFVETKLSVGDRVLYNKMVPWKVTLQGDGEKKYVVPYCGEQDIVCKLVGEEVIPLGDRLLVEKEVTKKVGLIEIPFTVREDKAFRIGKTLATGQRVLYLRKDCVPVEIGDKEFDIVHEKDLLSTFDEEVIGGF